MKDDESLRTAHKFYLSVPWINGNPVAIAAEIASKLELRVNTDSEAMSLSCAFLILAIEANFLPAKNHDSDLNVSNDPRIKDIAIDMFKTLDKAVQTLAD